MAPDEPTSTALEGLIYFRPNLRDFTLDDNDLGRTCPLDNGRHRIDPKSDLGVLERLPLELVSDILVQIDLLSLTDFRRVNQRAMQVVDSISQYQTIVRHGLDALRGILSIETGSRISCQDLFRTLRNPKCEACDDFGGFIYALTCSRVCFLCLSEEPRYLPLLASEVVRRFGLDRSILASIPSMRSVPGCYSPNERTCRSRLILIDTEAARCAGVAFHGSAPAMEQHVAGVASKRLEGYRNRMSRIAAGEPEPTPRRPPKAIARDGRMSNPRRFMAIVRAPWVHSPTNSAEWGFHCVGCQRQYRSRPLHWRRKYSTNTFDDHIKQCGHINDGNHCQPTGL